MRTAAEALALARAARTYAPVNNCMRAVLDWYGLIPIDGYPSAQAGWAITRNKHTDRTPPAGAPVYFTGGRYGHVALATGDGERVRSTGIDKLPVFDTTITELERLTRDKYAGWAGDFSGRPITYQEDNMTPEQAAQLAAIYGAIFKPYGSQLDAIVNVIRNEVPPMVGAGAGIDYDKLADAIFRRALKP